MQNSDSGTSIKLNPGDRVRIAHNPKYDRGYSAEQNQARQALAGQEGSIRERTVTNAYRVALMGSAERGAWFEADELAPIVTDPDGHEVGGPAAPLDVLDAAVQQALAAAKREAQGWHSAALLARGEAEEARDALRVVQGEADALRGKLGAAEGDRDGWRSRALAAEAKLTRETEEVARLEAALRTRDVQLDESRRQRKAAEGKLAAERSIHETAALGAVKLAKRLADVGAAWGRMRAFLLALPRPLGAAGIEGVDAVDKALGGAVVQPERECCWEATLEQRVAEVEARLGRLESGEALAKMLEDAAKRAVGDRIFGAVTP